MASLGHVAVGLAAARVSRDRASAAWSWPSAACWTAISLLPDADVIGFSLGVPYEAPWGHRGATHSFAFSIGVGLAIGLAAARLGLKPWRTGVTAAAVLASHAVFDTLTDGGLGCALLWPFDLTRYFAPWNPIPVAPIGWAFLTPYGFVVAAAELLLFSPLFVWAMRPATIRRLWITSKPIVGAWAALVLVMASPLSGSIQDAALGVALRENTEYASGFSERVLKNVSVGLSERDVQQMLGDPLRFRWLYRSGGPPACVVVQLEDSRVIDTLDPDRCSERGVRVGASGADVERILGPPSDVCWLFTRSRGGRPYRLRAVCFAEGRVTEVIRWWYED